MADLRLNVGTITSAVSLLSDAVRDTHNALGQTGQVAAVSQYGNLVPDLLHLASNAGALPSAPEDLPAGVASDLTKQVALDTGVSQQNASQVVSGTIALFAHLLSGLLHDAEKLAPLFKRH